MQVTPVIFLDPESNTIQTGEMSKTPTACPFYHRTGQTCPYCNNSEKSAYIRGAIGTHYAPVENVLAVVTRGKEQRGDIVYSLSGELVGVVIEPTKIGLMVWDVALNRARIIRNRSMVVVGLPLAEALEEVQA
jgi:hypothetical protein